MVREIGGSSPDHGIFGENGDSRIGPPGGRSLNLAETCGKVSEKPAKVPDLRGVPGWETVPAEVQRIAKKLDNIASRADESTEEFRLATRQDVESLSQALERLPQGKSRDRLTSVVGEWRDRGRDTLLTDTWVVTPQQAAMALEATASMVKDHSRPGGLEKLRTGFRLAWSVSQLDGDNVGSTKNLAALALDTAAPGTGAILRLPDIIIAATDYCLKTTECS